MILRQVQQYFGTSRNIVKRSTSWQTTICIYMHIMIKAKIYPNAFMGYFSVESIVEKHKLLVNRLQPILVHARHKFGFEATQLQCFYKNCTAHIPRRVNDFSVFHSVYD